MAEHQTIIVYRNAAEATFWDSVSGAWWLVPLLAGVVVGRLAFVLLTSIRDKFRPSRNLFVSTKSDPLLITVSMAAGVVTAWLMWI